MKKTLFFLALYAGLIAVAETLSASAETAQFGLIGHGSLLIALLIHTALTQKKPEHPVYLTLTLAPLIRLVSLTLPLKGLPMIYWYLLVGAPVFIAVLLIIRLTGIQPRQLGLVWRKWFLQILIGLLGVGLGLIEYLILRPAPLAESLAISQLWLPALILLIFTGLLEEVIFRGLMQSVIVNIIGKWSGILVVSVLFAVMHLGYQSVWDVVFVFGVAVLFGLIRLTSGSIIGITLAHGVTNITLFLVFPFLLFQPITPVEPPITAAVIAQMPVIPEPVPTRTFTSTNEPIITVIPSSTPVARMPAATTTQNPVDMSIPTNQNDQITGDLSDDGISEPWWSTPESDIGALEWAVEPAGNTDQNGKWQITFQECGQYEIDVFIPENMKEDPIQFGVEHPSGLAITLVHPDGRLGTWVHLGLFWMDREESAFITAEILQTTGKIAASASFSEIRWNLLSPCQHPTNQH